MVARLAILKRLIEVSDYDIALVNHRIHTRRCFNHLGVDSYPLGLGRTLESPQLSVIDTFNHVTYLRLSLSYGWLLLLVYPRWR